MTGVAQSDPTDTEAPSEDPQEEIIVWETMVSAANKALSVQSRLRLERPSPELLESSRMEETHKDADRTKGRTLRRLSKLEDPWNGSNTWEAESSEERQKGLSPEEEREPDKRSGTLNF